jgi:hypothetical protein
MLSFKAGVKLQGIQPEILLAIYVANEVYSQYGVECVLTSCLDGTHSKHSLHYKGYAVDVRTRNAPQNTRQTIADVIQHRLGDEYDVVHESTHIHIEYDPK